MKRVAQGAATAAAMTMLALAACGGDDSAPRDASTNASDARVADARPAADAAPQDSHAPDASPDGAPPDAARPDAARPDAAPPDAATPDAATVDAAEPDAAPPPDASLPPPPLGGVVFTIAMAGTTFDDPTWLVRIPLDGGPATNLTSPAGNAFAPVLSKDHQRLFFVGTPGSGSPRSVYAVPVDGSTPAVDLAQIPPGFPAYLHGGLELSADGDRLLFRSSDPNLFTVSVDGGARAVVATDVLTWAWRPDGQLVYVRAGSPGDRLMLSCADHDCSHTPLAPDQRVDAASLALAPDGRHVAFLARSGTSTAQALWLLDLPSENLRQLAPSVDRNGELLWSPDSSRLSYLTRSAALSQVHIACADGSCDVVVPVALPFSTGYGDRDWAPDSRHLALLAYAAPVRLFSACADGSCLHQFAIPTDSNVGEPDVSWSPDGHLLHQQPPPTLDVAARMAADCAEGECATILWSASRVYFDPAWSGNRLGYSDNEGIWVREGLTGPARRLRPEIVNLVGFDAAGLRLLYRQPDGLHAVRVDGLGGQRLDAQVSPAPTSLIDPTVMLP